MDHRTDARDVGTANLEFARALLDELRARGAAAAFVCPGSRSTPLALAVAGEPAWPHSVHVDERSAAFQALGYAKAAARPVVLICTSGTAGANFLPAVAEAHQSRVPLIVLTADRPPELRAWGAAQTMEQRTLFAGFTRWSEEAPCPSERPGELAYARALARRAVAESSGPAPGPVHLNLPFREPLLPESLARSLPGSPLPSLAVPTPAPPDVPVATPGTTAGPVIDAPAGEALARELRGIERGVLVFGPDVLDEALPAAAHALAAGLGWPIVADPASGLRAGAATSDALVHGADLVLRDPAAADGLCPELVVRFGSLPTSAAVAAWIARHASADVWLVDPAGAFRDPQHRASRVLRMTAPQFGRLAAPAGASRSSRSPWLARWQHADRVARAAATAAIDAEARFLAPHVVRELWSALPDGAALYAANSMAIRDLDRFAGPRAAALRVLANRGVNGIDGQVSAALGAAAALGRPTVLWCGDLALLHDVAGLLAARLQDADLVVVVGNDDGGGIFEYLPAARALPRPLFEHLFAVPHGLDLCELARGLGWTAVRTGHGAEFRAALSRALGGGRHLIEVPIDRAANTALHDGVHERVRARLRAEPLP